MFWEDGYRALSALDDDGDGWLSGEELRGLSVWRDRNGNGLSEAGEVVPLLRAGVEAVAARPEGRREGTLWKARGVRMKDGRLLPSYDWTPSEIGPARGR